MDGTPDVVKFAETVEKVCVDLVEAGKMTKDLALLISDKAPHLTTDEYLERRGRGAEEADGVEEGCQECQLQRVWDWHSWWSKSDHLRFGVARSGLVLLPTLIDTGECGLFE